MPKPFSEAQLAILTTAAKQPERQVELPANLPIVARNAVIRSMLAAGLLEEMCVQADQAERVCRQEPGRLIGLKATAAGLAAAGVVLLPPPTLPRTLREATAALLAAWDEGEGRPGLPAASRTK